MGSIFRHWLRCFYSTGVGAYFQKCTFDNKSLEVRAILPGGPVEHSGCIEVGDVLLEVFGWMPALEEQ